MDGNKKKRLIKDVIWCLVFLAAAAGVLLFTMVQVGGKKLRQPAAYGVPSEAEDPEAYRTIEFHGDTYTYRESLVNILCMGIDGRDKAVENTVYGAGPCSDAIYLAVLDLDQKKMTLLNISRDTMTGVRFLDSFGKDMGVFTSHLTLQYGCGDGLHGSCQMTSEAVSRLLGGIPIHAYAALYWNAVKPLTDAVGPVPVEVPDYMCWVNPPVFHHSGYTELDGRQALEFVRERDIDIQGSNEERSIHQQEFLQSLFRVVKEKIKKNPLLAWKMRIAVKDYLVTDIEPDELLTLASWAGSWEMERLDIRNLPGESVEGDLHDEFYVDEDGKQEILLELFYEKTDTVLTHLR